MTRRELASGLFLVVLLSFLFVPIYLSKSIVLGIFSSMVVIFAVLSEGKTRKLFWLELFLCISILTLSVFQFMENNAVLRAMQYVLFLIAAAIHVILLTRRLLYSRAVSADFVISSINGFLLLGFLFAVFCSFLEFCIPGSFSYSKAIDSQNLHLFIYFSFVTLATLGYGDFLAASSLAQSLSLVIAIFGTLYSILVIGLVLGKFLQREGERG